MNIEKIKNYNQKLLAVTGTLVALFVLLGLMGLMLALVKEIRWLFPRENENVGLIAEEEVQELQQENKRKQVISYDLPQLVDTVNLVYMIPVSHKTLKKAEDIDDNYIEEQSFGFSGSGKRGSRYSKVYNGYFNNLLIYDHKKNETKKLYEGRMQFDHINTEYFEDDILLVFTASTKDTNKDGVIDFKDLSSLMIYSLKEKKLRTVAIENTAIKEFSFVEDQKDLIISFGLDYNKDGKFDQYSEPTVIKKYDFKAEKLQNVIDTKLSEELQKQLQGSSL
ncbi:hypothetical protein [Flammeovirga aprica]|uniref:EF-hand domain-containing protein n=1 Tax=Flammeovirga aprica JL-4 TaxID=694437 RepID=A0A7X9P322_9BACT|nr:hypothetical protein [Flammeovirga aprica]NME68634.1 hypothetical protein [Flammeovirga aprica JL-4]